METGKWLILLTQFHSVDASWLFCMSVADAAVSLLSELQNSLSFVILLMLQWWNKSSCSATESVVRVRESVNNERRIHDKPSCKGSSVDVCLAWGKRTDSWNGEEISSLVLQQKKQGGVKILQPSGHLQRLSLCFLLCYPQSVCWWVPKSHLVSPSWLSLNP